MCYRLSMGWAHPEFLMNAFIVCSLYTIFFKKDVKTWTITHFVIVPYLLYNFTEAKLDIFRNGMVSHFNDQSTVCLSSKRFLFIINWLSNSFTVLHHTRKDLVFHRFLIIFFVTGQVLIGKGGKWLLSLKIYFTGNLYIFPTNQISLDWRVKSWIVICT